MKLLDAVEVMRYNTGQIIARGLDYQDGGIMGKMVNEIDIETENYQQFCRILNNRGFVLTGKTTCGDFDLDIYLRKPDDQA